MANSEVPDEGPGKSQSNLLSYVTRERIQWHSQNAQTVTNIKGRLLDQATILFHCVPFQMGTSLKGKNLLPLGANSFLYEQFLKVWKITFITLSDLP